MCSITSQIRDFRSWIVKAIILIIVIFLSTLPWANFLLHWLSKKGEERANPGWGEKLNYHFDPHPRKRPLNRIGWFFGQDMQYIVYMLYMDIHCIHVYIHNFLYITHCMSYDWPRFEYICQYLNLNNPLAFSLPQSNWWFDTMKCLISSYRKHHQSSFRKMQNLKRVQVCNAVISCFTLVDSPPGVIEGPRQSNVEIFGQKFHIS